MMRRALLHRTRQERGAGTVEYAGITLIVSSLLAAAVIAPSADVISPRVAHAVCQAFDTLPGLDIGCADAPAAEESRVDDLADSCVVRRTDRDTSINVQVKVVRGERGTGDTISHNGDGSASVSLNENTGIGVAAPTRGNKLGKGTHSSGAGASADFNAHLTGSGELEYTYNFPADLGGAEAAQGFLDSRRHIPNQVIDTVVPGAQTVREGFTRGTNAVGNGLEDAGRWLFGNELSEEQRQHRAAVQGLSEADTVSAAVSLQGLVGVSGQVGYGDKDVARGSADVSASATGTVSTALNESGTNAYTGQLRYDLNGDVTVGLQGRDGDSLAGIPPFLNVGGSHGQTFQYTVEYDSSGNPVRLVFTGETRSGLDFGLNPSSSGGGQSRSVNGQAQTGTVSQESRILDLTDETNRQLFDNVFATGGVSVGDYSAHISLPRVMQAHELPQFFNDANELWTRTETDAVFVTYEYDMFGHGVGGKYKNEKAVGARVAGAGFSHTDRTLMLTSARARDARTFEPYSELASCGD